MLRHRRRVPAAQRQGTHRPRGPADRHVSAVVLPRRARRVPCAAALLTGARHCDTKRTAQRELSAAPCATPSGSGAERSGGQQCLLRRARWGRLRICAPRRGRGASRAKPRSAIRAHGQPRPRRAAAARGGLGQPLGGNNCSDTRRAPPPAARPDAPRRVSPPRGVTTAMMQSDAAPEPPPEPPAGAEASAPVHDAAPLPQFEREEEAPPQGWSRVRRVRELYVGPMSWVMAFCVLGPLVFLCPCGAPSLMLGGC